MDRGPCPPFPLSLGTIAEEHVLSALTAAELGAVVRLAHVAWTREPPCSLPDDDLLLARWAGLNAAEWADARPAVTRVYTPQRGGLLLNEWMVRAFNGAALAQQQRSARARAGGRARHGSTGSRDRPSLRLARGGQLQASSELAASKLAAGGGSPPTPPSSQRPRPCAQPERSEIQCAPLGARARALIGDLRIERDLRRAGDMLRGASFPWADSNKQRVHPETVARILASRHARRLLEQQGELPLFVDWVLSEIKARAKRAAEGGEPIRTPIGMLIAAFGAQEYRPTKPWVTPIWHRESWDRRETQRAEGEDLRERIARIREQRGCSPAATGAADGTG